jgi:hypothetical protein
MSTLENVMTDYSSKCAILTELWVNYRNDEQFQDFIEYNDLGLPLAYAIAEGVVSSTELAQRFVEETFDVFLAGLDITDTGFENLDEILSINN